MNRKIFAIVLVVCLAVGVAFAAEKGDFKVGAQLGYGGDFIKYKYDSKTYESFKNGGFYFAAVADYALTDEISVKAEAGLNTMGKRSFTTYFNGNKISLVSGKASENSPLQFSVYAGAAYNVNISDEFTLQAGAGVDMMIGKISNADDAKINAGIGIGAELNAEYEVAKNIAVNVGVRFGWHFINTNKDKSDLYDALQSLDLSIGHTSLKVFAGATYTL